MVISTNRGRGHGATVVCGMESGVAVSLWFTYASGPIKLDVGHFMMNPKS